MHNVQVSFDKDQSVMFSYLFFAQDKNSYFAFEDNPDTITPDEPPHPEYVAQSLVPPSNPDVWTYLVVPSNRHFTEYSVQYGFIPVAISSSMVEVVGIRRIGCDGIIAYVQQVAPLESPLQKLFSSAVQALKKYL